ncbi:MAG TPA: butyrate kinase [Longimicrobiales bacterium]|nr:butyrate kinase [Longimicrobiales bacterium]
MSRAGASRGEAASRAAADTPREGGALILALNPGSTSTKIGLFRDGHAVGGETVRHPDDTLRPFARRPVLDQLDMRLAAVRTALEPLGVPPDRPAAVVGRGGLLAPLASGTYAVNDAMLDDLRAAERGEHASNLGAFLAHGLAEEAGCPAFVVDPVSVDEWEPVARLSGLAGLDRECLSHALNTKAVAKRFARQTGRPYRELRLVVAHLGSGISISAHRDGRMVDVCNPREEGPFSADRAGGLPALKLLDLAFSGKAAHDDLERGIFREGGVYSYLGTRDLADVERRVAAGDADAALVVDAMLYQIAREIGAMATVLHGRVDAILLTGGMAHSPSYTSDLAARIDWIAPVHVFPGEDELAALAEGAARVIRGEEAAREYRSTTDDRRPTFRSS